MQLPTAPVLLASLLTLIAPAVSAQYSDGSHSGLQARDIYARAAAAEAYDEAMSLHARSEDLDGDGNFGLYRRDAEPE
ncbi:hypothetical protein MMC17_001868 [Xylographa soralifera]|nr:hypothetical protein [Xylographa soralifera]